MVALRDGQKMVCGGAVGWSLSEGHHAAAPAGRCGKVVCGKVRTNPHATNRSVKHDYRLARGRRGDMAQSPMTLATAIASCLAAHAEAVERFGTATPELAVTVPIELRNKMQRQRQKVATSLEGNDPGAHAQHVEALTKGLRIVMRRLDPRCS
jgi:hypothetical protein